MHLASVSTTTTPETSDFVDLADTQPNTTTHGNVQCSVAAVIAVCRRSRRLPLCTDHKNGHPALRSYSAFCALHLQASCRRRARGLVQVVRGTAQVCLDFPSDIDAVKSKRGVDMSKGTVKWFNSQKGYGFVDSAAGDSRHTSGSETPAGRLDVGRILGVRRFRTGARPSWKSQGSALGVVGSPAAAVLRWWRLGVCRRAPVGTGGATMVARVAVGVARR